MARDHHAMRVIWLLAGALTALGIIQLSTFGWIFSATPVSQSMQTTPSLAAALEAHVKKLSHDIGDRSVYAYGQLQQAERYISEQLRSYGYTIEFQPYTAEGKIVKNIIATKKGTHSPHEIVLTGAHYDTCFNPGADDNASGVAGLLELARMVSAKQNGRTVRFVAFVNEEPPFFKTDGMGSRVYARAARERGDELKAVLVLEMIGYYSDKPNSQRYPPFLGIFYPNKGDFIAAVGNFQSGALVRQVVSRFQKKSRVSMQSVVTFGFVPGIDFSDHWSFWKEGYRAVMVTDTAFYRYPHYHSSEDTYEKLDYARMAEVVQGLSAVIDELAR